MSPATFAILTNPEVIAVDQDRAGIQGHRLSQDGPLFPIDPGPLKDWAPATVSDERQLEIWVKPLADGRRAVGLFNATEAPATMTVRFDALGLSGRVKVRDLWERRPPTFIMPTICCAQSCQVSNKRESGTPDCPKLPIPLRLLTHSRQFSSGTVPKSFDENSSAIKAILRPFHVAWVIDYHGLPVPRTSPVSRLNSTLPM